jgi:hypothetical protein
MVMSLKTFILSVFGGLGVTLITGFIPRRVLAGATRFGWPFAWLIRLVLAPQHYPWKVAFSGFIVDIIIWSLAVFLLVYYLKNRKKKL